MPTPASLARELNIPRSTVLRRLRVAGVLIPRYSRIYWPEVDWPQLRILASGGHPDESLAASRDVRVQATETVTPPTTQQPYAPRMVGADPEFEFWEGDRLVEAHDILRGGTGARLGTDGCSSTGELRPPPGNPEEVTQNIRGLLQRLAHRLTAISGGHRITVHAGAGKFEALGGHIHFGGYGFKPIPLRVLAALDQWVSTPLNAICRGTARREHWGYGGMSAWRQQPHGWEYRTPPSWLSTPSLTLGVLGTAFSLMGRAEGDLILPETTPIDPAGRERLYSLLGEKAHYALAFYNELDRFQQQGGYLEDGDILAAWGVREAAPASNMGTEKPNVQQTITFTRGDGDFMDCLPQTVEVFCSAAPRINEIQFNGARQERGGGLFVPSRLELPVVADWHTWEHGFWGLAYWWRRGATINGPELAATHYKELCLSVAMSLTPAGTTCTIVGEQEAGTFPAYQSLLYGSINT